MHQTKYAKLQVYSRKTSDGSLYTLHVNATVIRGSVLVTGDNVCTWHKRFVATVTVTGRKKVHEYRRRLFIIEGAPTFGANDCTQDKFAIGLYDASYELIDFFLLLNNFIFDNDATNNTHACLLID